MKNLGTGMTHTYTRTHYLLANTSKKYRHLQQMQTMSEIGGRTIVRISVPSVNYDHKVGELRTIRLITIAGPEE